MPLPIPELCKYTSVGHVVVSEEEEENVEEDLLPYSSNELTNIKKASPNLAIYEPLLSHISVCMCVCVSEWFFCVLFCV